MIIIPLILMVLVLASIYNARTRNEDYGKHGCNFERAYIGYSSYLSTGISLYDDLGLNETTVNKINNETFTLRISSREDSSSVDYHYFISNNHAFLRRGSENPGLDIESAYGEEYGLSFHYIINSTYPDVRNISIMGIDNYLNISITITNEWKTQITLDDEYSNFSSMIDYDNSGLGEIWIIDSPNRDGIPGHVFAIRIQLVCI